MNQSARAFIRYLTGAALLGAAAALLFAFQAEAQPAGDAGRGHTVAKRHCGSCHAVGRFGRSRTKNAPTFRDLPKRYDIEGLAESVAEGISVGHPLMPEKVLTDQEAADLMAWLRRFEQGARH